MTTTPKPTPPRSRPTAITVPPAPTLPDVAMDTLGHIDAALALMGAADRHAADALACRALDEHALAGRFREAERMALKRADLLVAVRHADLLESIAADLNALRNAR